MSDFWLGLPLGVWALIAGQILLSFISICQLRLGRSLSWQITMMDRLLSRAATSRGGLTSFENSKKDADPPG